MHTLMDVYTLLFITTILLRVFVCQFFPRVQHIYANVHVYIGHMSYFGIIVSFKYYYFNLSLNISSIVCMLNSTYMILLSLSFIHTSLNSIHQSYYLSEY